MSLKYTKSKIDASKIKISKIDLDPNFIKVIIMEHPETPKKVPWYRKLINFFTFKNN